ncbi:PREDICTED: mitogen-activated protein kinase kinase kinase 3-like [Tarenaya hassleriana]|uniref:mitogen-activated protein kinase kinase kinase 3-like n=1 Tax=Tarenaya hassleriana TaxID=28532 RepID=UPI00053C1FBD|nr:PREDICTED: mitogen-activated protein kinase kinase kinase 3-like [Tarenaya hassleriana]
MEWTRGRTLGRGSSATVYAATCHNSGEIIAVKSAELSRSGFLQREAKILSSLNSPYVVGYRGCHITKMRSDSAVYNLLMEYAPSGTVADVAAKNGSGLGETMFAKYTRQIIRGLEYLHSKGIVHCDIKGSNVLIGESGDAMIADFGCAKRVDPEPDSAEPIRGTPAFMAPEAARGEKQGKESDIWAVGCTVIEMATGSPPWTAEAGDPFSVIYRVGYSGESPEIPCFLTEQAKDFLRRCLERKPEERWTASQLLNHPFVCKPDPEPGLIPGSISNSPTSVMDQLFWRSVEEEEDLGHPSRWVSHDERIGRLRCVGYGGPTWDLEGGDWVTVRERCDGTMIGGSHCEFVISGNVM